MQSAHQGGVNGVSWCKSATPGETKRTFVTCGCDSAVCIWEYPPFSFKGNLCSFFQHLSFDPEKGEVTKVRTLEGHRDWVRDVAWAPAPASASTGVIASCSEVTTLLMVLKRDDTVPARHT